MRVIKIKLNVGINTIRHLGTLKLVHLEYQGSKLMGWFTEVIDSDTESEYEVYIALTGEIVPDDYNYVCTTQLAEGGGYFVVHGFD